MSDSNVGNVSLKITATIGWLVNRNDIIGAWCFEVL